MAISSVLGSSALLPAGLGFRNVIINGGFDVWQRGTTAAIPSSSSTSYLADRWSGYRGTTGSTQSRATAGLDGFQYALRIQRDSGNTGTGVIFMNQSFETSVMAKLANKQVTLSFWARAGANYSSSGLSFTARVVAGTGTEANVIYTGVAGSTEPVATTVTLTTSWQRFTATGLIPSGSNGGGVYFFYAPTGTAGAADYVDITGVQLEQNYQPTPFEQRPYGVELALCQRYFEKSYNATEYAGTSSPLNSVTYYITGLATATHDFYYRQPFIVTKRATPTVSVYSNAGTVSKASDYNAGGADIAASVPQAGFAGFAINANGASASSINVQWHWTASAEL